MKNQNYEKIKCGQCGKDVVLVKHVNKCKCGARIKVLDYYGETQ